MSKAVRRMRVKSARAEAWLCCCGSQRKKLGAVVSAHGHDRDCGWEQR